MNKALIYQPARSSMQSAPLRHKEWVLEFEPESKLFVEPLMGWTGGADTTRQVRLYFATREKAIEYARAKGIVFELRLPKERSIRPKSYADNFRFDSARRNSANSS